MTDKTFIITGTTGFIGGSLYRLLKSNKVKCIGVSRNKSDNSDYCVKNYSEVINLYDQNTYLINFAGDNREISQDEINMLEILSARFKDRMFFMSSAQVYGLEHKYSNEESSRLDGITDYAKKKIFAEKLVLSNKGKILRLSNIYGKGMSLDTVWHDILNQVKNNNNLITLKNKLAIRDFLHIDDFCSLIYKIILSDENLNIINVGSGKGTSLVSITNLIYQKIYPNRPLPEILSKNDVEICNILNINLAMREYDWEPHIDIKEGISRWLA